MKLSLPLFLLAEAASLFGNSAIAIVLPWLILSRTHDPAAAGFVSMLTGLPAIAAALIGGHLIDRVGRRRMAVLADCGSALSVAALALVDRAFGLDLGWFVALGLLGALFDVPGMTARETLMASVAEAARTSLDRVAGLRQAAFGLSFLAGPALAGVLLSVLDPIRVVWITAGCSTLAALATAAMPLLPTPGGAPAKESPLAGWRVIRGNRGLVAVLVISLGSMLPVAPLLSVILPAHFQGMGAPALLGTASSAFAVGTIAGSGIYAAGLSRWRWPTWVVSVLLYTASFALIATLRGFWLVAAGMALAGIASGLMGPLFTIGMTEHVPDTHRGKVFGLLNALSLLAAPIGLGAMAVLLSRWRLGVGAWGLLVVWLPVAAYALLARGLRDFLTPPVPADPDEPEEERC